MATLSLLPAVTLDGDELEPADLYFGDDDFDPPALSPEEEARQDALEAEYWSGLPDPADPVADKALEVLRAAGLDARHEVDFDADGDGRPVSWSTIVVACHPGCGPVAHVHADSLADSLSCEAPEGAESNCARADEALAAAGAYRAGWAS